MGQMIMFSLEGVRLNLSENLIALYSLNKLCLLFLVYKYIICTSKNKATYLGLISETSDEECRWGQNRWHSPQTVSCRHLSSWSAVSGFLLPNTSLILPLLMKSLHWMLLSCRWRKVQMSSKVCIVKFWSPPWWLGDGGAFRKCNIIGGLSIYLGHTLEGIMGPGHPPHLFAVWTWEEYLCYTTCPCHYVLLHLKPQASRTD